jgi:gliding motility-associated-like protein
MKQLFILILFFICSISNSNAQFGGGGGGKKPGKAKFNTPFLAGAELKVRPMNRVAKLSPNTKDTVEVKLILYRDCEANPGFSYGPPLNPTVDTMIALIYSTELCEYFKMGLMFNEFESDGNSTPLCPYNPAKTKCDTSISSNIGYRTEVYIDTIVLPGNSSNWVIGLQYSTGVHGRMNWYTKKYDPQGERCSFLQMSPPPAGTTYLAPVVPPSAPFLCRINAFNTQSQQNDATEGFFYIECTYSNKLADGFFPADNKGNKIPRYRANTTPSSAVNPLIYQCIGNPRVYDLGYYDSENHKMEFFLSTPYKYACFGDPICGQGDRIKTGLTFVNGCSESNPLCGSSSFNLDQSTGIINFNAAGPVGKYKTAYRIIEKDDLGNTIGEVYRDAVISIINPPGCNTANSVSNSSYFLPDLTDNFINCALAPNRDKVIEACPGSSIKFRTRAFSTSDIANASIVISAELHPYISSTGGYLTGEYHANNFPTFDTAFGTLHWNIPANAEPGIYPVVFQIRDCIDGFILSRTLVYKIRVNKKNKVSWEYLAFQPKTISSVFQLNPRSGRSFNCGSGMSHLYTGSGTEVDALYMWKLVDNTSNSTLDSIPAAIDNYYNPDNSLLTTGKNYTVIMITNQFCNNTDTVTIVDKPSISPTADFTTSDKCFGTVGKIEIKGLTVAQQTTSFYDWQALNSLYTSTPSYFSNTADPLLVKPNNIYNIYVVSVDTCIYPLSVNVPLDGIKPRAKFKTDKQYVCPGDTIGVSGFVTTSICGQSQFSVQTGPLKTATYQGDQSNTNSTPKIFTATPAADRGRTAILYRADDLKKQCFKPGLIKGASFYIEGINDPITYNNIDIWVKCTDLTDLGTVSDFEDTNDMIKVTSLSSRMLSIGWNNFNFGGGFTWDGETNLYFYVTTSCNRACNANVPTSPAYGDHLTTYVSIIGKYGNGAANLTQAPMVRSNFRHNIQFDYHDLDESTVTYAWNNSPSTLISRINPNISGNAELTPRIVSFVPLTYKVKVTNGKCDSNYYVNAEVDTNYKISVTPDVVNKCPGDTIHVSSEKGKLVIQPMILNCGPNFKAACKDIFSQFSTKDKNLAKDSCRVQDTIFYPIIGNKYSLNQGSVVNSPFGGVTGAALPYPTTDKRVQILYTATELKANKQMRPGYIKELAFYIDTLQYKGLSIGKNAMQNFTVRMKCVSPSQDSFVDNNFESTASFDEVFFATEFETIFGINYIKLDNIFAWDGKVGIMIDICFDNFTGTSYNADQVRATTLNRKRFIQQAGNTTGAQAELFGCAFTTGIRDFTRPNVGFVLCKPTRTPPPIPREVNWAPTSFISNTMIPDPIVYNKFTTQYYTILDYVDTTYGKQKVVCRVRDTMRSIVDRPKVKFDPPYLVSCEGKSVTVAAGVYGMNQNLYNYQWDTTQYGKVKSNYLSPNQVITPPNEGYHYVTVTSVNNPNCYNVDSVYVYIQELKTMPDLGGAALICPGDSLLLSIPTNTGYKNPKWKFNGNIIESGYSLKVAAPGNYSMVVDSGACTNISDIKTLTLRTKLTATLVNTNITVCEGDSAMIMYNQNDNVSNPLWNVGLTTPYIKVTQPGKYFLVKPRDQYGCIMNVKDTATVKLIDNPDFKLLDDTICISNNQKITIQPTPFDPSAKYKWDPDGRYLPYLDVYTVGPICVTREKGTCFKTVCATIINDTSGGIFLGKNKAICCDEVLTLDGNPDGKKYTGYKWSTGEFSQVIYTKPNASGLYIVEATKPNGCKDTGSIFIDSKCGQVRAKPEKEKIFLGQKNNIIGSHLGVNATNIIYSWIPSDPDNKIDKGTSLNSIAIPRDTGDVEYILVMTVIDSNYMPPKPFCIENEVVRFKVAPNKLDTVNTFSPDGDGINDVIYPKIQGIVDLKEFKVYNRFGQLLHNNAKQGWDGRYNGEYQPVGVYMALISYELVVPKKDKIVKYDKIPITLIR